MALLSRNGLSRAQVEAAIVEARRGVGADWLDATAYEPLDGRVFASTTNTLTANRAYVYPVVLPVDATVTGITVYIDTPSGSATAALTTSNGTALTPVASSGSVALTASANVQTLALTTPYAGGRGDALSVVIAADNSTARFLSIANPTRIAQLDDRARYVNGWLPTAGAITLASLGPVGMMIWVRLEFAP